MADLYNHHTIHHRIMYHVTTHTRPSALPKMQKKSKRLRPINSGKKGCLLSLFALIISSFLMLQVSCQRKEISSLPIGGCFYFSKTDYKEIIAWRNKHTPTVYYHTINGREYTFYTQDAKEINAYKRKFPDVIEIDCYDSSDTLIQKVWRRNGNNKD